MPHCLREKAKKVSIFNLQYFYCVQKNPRNPPILRQLRGSPLPPHTLRFGENSLFFCFFLFFPTPQKAAGLPRALPYMKSPRKGRDVAPCACQRPRSVHRALPSRLSSSGNPSWFSTS